MTMDTNYTVLLHDASYLIDAPTHRRLRDAIAAGEVEARFETVTPCQACACRASVVVRLADIVSFVAHDRESVLESVGNVIPFPR